MALGLVSRALFFDWSIVRRLNMGGNSEILNDTHSVCFFCDCDFKILENFWIYHLSWKPGVPKSDQFQGKSYKTSFSTFSRSENILNLRTRAMALGLVSSALFFDWSIAWRLNMGGNCEILNDTHSVCVCVCDCDFDFLENFLINHLSWKPESLNQTNFRENHIKPVFLLFRETKIF